MSQPEKTNAHASPLENARALVRKPYKKPAVRYEQVFETRALTCGKVSTTQKSCQGFNHKNS